ncbi:BCCT family transporter [Vibrio lentus]|nr:BCCT family transporter [Vibrio lentus]
MTDQLGFLYLALGLAACAFMVYVVFSDMGQKIKLGEADEEPEFKTASWAAMLFLWWYQGRRILYWGCIGGLTTYQSPPFQLEPGVKKPCVGLRPMVLFHWGPIAWSIYLIPAILLPTFSMYVNSLY